MRTPLINENGGKGEKNVTSEHISSFSKWLVFTVFYICWTHICPACGLKCSSITKYFWLHERQSIPLRDFRCVNSLNLHFKNAPRIKYDASVLNLCFFHDVICSPWFGYPYNLSVDWQDTNCISLPTPLSLKMNWQAACIHLFWPACWCYALGHLSSKTRVYFALWLSKYRPRLMYSVLST